MVKYLETTLADINKWTFDEGKGKHVYVVNSTELPIALTDAEFAKLAQIFNNSETSIFKRVYWHPGVFHLHLDAAPARYDHIARLQEKLADPTKPAVTKIELHAYVDDFLAKHPGTVPPYKHWIGRGALPKVNASRSLQCIHAMEWLKDDQ